MTTETEGTAQAQPADFVRSFERQLEHPETRLKTDTRENESDVFSGTNWGTAGKAAILEALRGRQAEANALATELGEYVKIKYALPPAEGRTDMHEVPCDLFWRTVSFLTGKTMAQLVDDGCHGRPLG